MNLLGLKAKQDKAKRRFGAWMPLTPCLHTVFLAPNWRHEGRGWRHFVHAMCIVRVKRLAAQMKTRVGGGAIRKTLQKPAKHARNPDIFALYRRMIGVLNYWPCRVVMVLI